MTTCCRTSARLVAAPLPTPDDFVLARARGLASARTARRRVGAVGSGSDGGILASEVKWRAASTSSASVRRTLRVLPTSLPGLADGALVRAACQHRSEVLCAQGFARRSGSRGRARRGSAPKLGLALVNAATRSARVPSPPDLVVSLPAPDQSSSPPLAASKGQPSRRSGGLSLSLSTTTSTHDPPVAPSSSHASSPQARRQLGHARSNLAAPTPSSAPPPFLPCPPPTRRRLPPLSAWPRPLARTMSTTRSTSTTRSASLASGRPA